MVDALANVAAEFEVTREEVCPDLIVVRWLPMDLVAGVLSERNPARLLRFSLRELLGIARLVVDAAARLRVAGRGERATTSCASLTQRHAAGYLQGMADRNGRDVHREQTDRSLNEERARTDAQVREHDAGGRRADAAATAAERADADANVRMARERADEQMGSRRLALQAEREVEDAAVLQEREAEDARREEERSAREGAVLQLFDREREQTDRHLRAERAAVDDTTTLRLRYLGMLAHDLRGMLTTIELQSATITREHVHEGEGSKTFVSAQRIRRVARRMERLVTDLIDTASEESGNLRIVFQEADLARAVAEIAEAYQPEARARRVVLGFEVREMPLLSIFDYERILQVLGNLVGNALKFTPAGGRVTIRGERHGDTVRASVQDTGPGIPPNKVEAIFEPFLQLDAREKGGIGLGLYIARTVVEAHRGKIWVESSPEGGSTFVFSLPAASARSVR